MMLIQLMEARALFLVWGWIPKKIPTDFSKKNDIFLLLVFFQLVGSAYFHHGPYMKS
jgi:hypothetical protein